MSCNFNIPLKTARVSRDYTIYASTRDLHRDDAGRFSPLRRNSNGSGKK